MQVENFNYLKEKGIKIYGKPLGRPPKNDSQTASQKYCDKNFRVALMCYHLTGKIDTTLS